MDLTHAEERGLLEQLATEPNSATRRRIKDKLVLANLWMVERLAKRYQGKGIDVADLQQEGVIGLMEAIDRFDLHQEARLHSYAWQWVARAMRFAIADKCTNVRLTRGSGMAVRRLREASGRGEELPTAEELGTSQRLRELLLQYAAPSKEPVNEVSVEPVDTTGARDVETLLSVLSERDASIVREYFGLDETTEISVQEIAVQHGLTTATGVRDVVERALKKMKKAADGKRVRKAR